MVDHTLTLGNCLTDGRKREILERRKVRALFLLLHYLVQLSENDMSEPYGEGEAARANERRCLNCDLDNLNDGTSRSQWREAKSTFVCRDIVNSVSAVQYKPYSTENIGYNATVYEKNIAE